MSDVQPCRQQTDRWRGQQGFVLITALILVVILTIMALAGVTLGSTQTRIAANTAAQEATFQAAEGALNQAQTNLLINNYPATSYAANTAGLYLYNSAAPPLWTTVNWNSGSAVIFSTWGSLPAGISTAYIIEKMVAVYMPGQQQPVNMYRITVNATQASGGAPVILQSLVQIPQ